MYVVYINLLYFCRFFCLLTIKIFFPKKNRHRVRHQFLLSLTLLVFVLTPVLHQLFYASLLSFSSRVETHHRSDISQPQNRVKLRHSQLCHLGIAGSLLLVIVTNRDASRHLLLHYEFGPLDRLVRASGCGHILTSVSCFHHCYF